MDKNKDARQNPELPNTSPNADHADMDKLANVPGQQLGLYNNSEDKDVKQMVTLLNNPGEENQSGRG